MVEGVGNGPLKTQKSTSALHLAAQICSQNQMADQTGTVIIASVGIHGFHSFLSNYSYYSKNNGYVKKYSAKKPQMIAKSPARYQPDRGYGRSDGN